MRRGEFGEFSVFINNLPHNLDKHGLKGIFQRAGKVSDSYIPSRKTRRNPIRFGFVHFWNRVDALKSIVTLNNVIIRGNKISVCMAHTKKRKRFRSQMHQTRRAPNISKSRIKKEQKQEGNKKVQLVRFSQENQPHKMFLKGQVNSKLEEWLN